jgi:hypothetical protein
MFAAVREISRHVVRYDKNPANYINAITDEIMERTVRRTGLETVRTATAELEVTLSVSGETEGVQPAASSERNSVLLSISARLQDLQDGETVTVWEHQQGLGQVMPNESDPQKLRQIRKELEVFFRQFESDYREARLAQAGNAPKAAASPTRVHDRPEPPLP